ncbi:MAG: hypothetical protein WA580_01190, partial [Acidimicrobiales bacterium]
SDTDPPILADALAASFTPIAVTEAIIATAAAAVAVRFPKNLLDLNFPPTQNASDTAVVPPCAASHL